MRPVRLQNYLVTTSVEDCTARKQFWDGRKPLVLDFPAQHALQKTSSGIILQRITKLEPESAPKIQNLPIPPTAIERAGKLKVKYPAKTGTKEKYLEFQIQALRPIRPTYLPSRKAKTRDYSNTRGQLFLFWGTRFYLIDFKPLSRRFHAKVNGKKIFSLIDKEGGYQIISYVDGLHFRFAGAPRLDIPFESSTWLSAEKMSSGGIYWGKHWWRANRVSTPERLPLDKMEAEELRDKRLYDRVLWTTLGGFAILMMSLQFFSLPSPEPPPKLSEPMTVSLKTPRVIPTEVVKPKPPEPPKKVVEKKPPAPAKLVKKPAPPKIIAKAKPIPQKVTAPPPPTPAQPPIEMKPDPAAEAAKAKARLSESLSFLSPNKKSPVTNISNEKVNSKYNTVGNVDDPKKANALALSNLTQSKKIEGPIETKNARNIQSDLVTTQKGLNDVQGRVSIGDLHSSDLQGEFGSSLGGNGLSVSGPGQVDNAEIERTLKKFLHRFQYCYEKELLTDNTLAGLVQIQWNIDMSGTPSEIKVLRSQLKKDNLHSCLIREIGKIHFPAPSGGGVMIKYPFKFTSSSI